MENQKPNNIQAFPKHPETKMGDAGMTLRDYFAAKAMQGLMSIQDKGTFSGIDEMCDECAKLSYQMADCLLKQREL